MRLYDLFWAMSSASLALASLGCESKPSLPAASPSTPLDTPALQQAPPEVVLAKREESALAPSPSPSPSPDVPVAKASPPAETTAFLL